MAKSTRFCVAVHVLTVLAVRRDEFTSSEFLSKSVDANPAAIRRSLGALLRAGWITSQHGVHGGAQLAVEPETISLADVYSVVEQHDVLHMHQPNPKCPVADLVTAELTSAIEDSEQAMQHALAKRTVADIAKKAAGKYSKWQKQMAAN